MTQANEVERSVSSPARDDYVPTRVRIRQATLAKQAAAHSGKIPKAEGAGGEEFGTLPAQTDAGNDGCVTLPQVLLRATEKSFRLLERTVEHGLDIQEKIHSRSRGDGFKVLREAGVAQVYASAHKIAVDLVGTQVRIDEAKLRAATSENVVAKILERLAEHDTRGNGTPR